MKNILLSLFGIFIIQSCSIFSMNTDDPIVQQNLKKEVETVLNRKKNELAALDKKLQQAQTEEERKAINKEIYNVKNRRDPMPPKMPSNS